MVESLTVFQSLAVVKSKEMILEKLKAYLREHLDVYQAEGAEVFACTDTAVRKVYKRLGITCKKRQTGIKNRFRIFIRIILRT